MGGHRTYRDAMDVTIVSGRNAVASLARTVVVEYEDVLAKCFEANILAPKHKFPGWVAHSKLAALPRRMGGGLYEVDWTVTEASKTRQSDTKMLLMVALNGADFELLDALPNWRDEYDLAVAVVFDGWVLGAFHQNVRNFDHLFVPYPEAVTSVASIVDVKVDVLPMAFDCLGIQYTPQRSNDILSYGRSSKAHLDALIKDPDISVFTQNLSSEVVGPKQQWGPSRSDWQGKELLRARLVESKIALAFDNTYTQQLEDEVHVSHQLKGSILTQRWFECLGAGCVVVGRRPTSPLVNQYLDWETSTIDLPESVPLGLEVIRGLLEDHERLQEMAARNRQNSLMRNDWRHRARQMLDILGVEEPKALHRELDLLDQASKGLSL